MAFPPGQAAAEWRAHWTLVLAAMLGFSVVGMSIYGLGAFIAPLHAEFGGSVALISSGPMVYATTSLVCQPLVGRMIDRWGPRRIALVGVILSAVTFALCHRRRFADRLAAAVAGLFAEHPRHALTSTWSSAVASEFAAGRGLALAFTLGGSAVAGVAAPNAATWLIAAYGWRTAYVVIALTVGAIVFVTTWFFFHSRLDGMRVGSAAAEADLPGVTLGEAARELAFYKLSFGIFTGYVMTNAVLVHLVRILEGAGLAAKPAAAVTALFGLFALAGKLICGLLVNRLPGHLITAAMAALAIPGYLILMAPGQPVLVLAFAVALIGTAGGALLTMSVYLATRHFGLRASARSTVSSAGR